ncbi:MAG: Clp protease ClpP [Odoribacter sp.]
MAKSEFDIDGYIETYGYSNTYVKSFLSEAGNNPVICRVCSYGGDFMMALNIKDQFALKGNVTVDISGYAASAATLIGLGAATTRISNTSFYLIHKVMCWVNSWGFMNEDQLTEVINHLEKIKDENEKMTLVAAKAYSEKSGKSVVDILNLMKEEKWLTADEAKEWGFVDEVYNTTGKLNIARISEKLNRLGLPVLPGSSSTVMTDSNETDTIVAKILSGLKCILPSKSTSDRLPLENINPDDQSIKKPQNKIEMKTFTQVNTILSVSSLESADGEGVYLNETQLQQLEDAIVANHTNIANLQQHETAYNDAVTRLDALHPDIAKADGLEAKVNKLQEKLSAKPAVAPSETNVDKSERKTDGANWDVLNALPHMQEDF